MSVLYLLEWEHRIDHRLNTSVRQQRHDFTRERIRRCDLLLERSRAHHRTDDVKTFAQDLVKRDVSFTAGHATNQDEPATKRHRFETRREIRTTIQIENNVESVATGRVLRELSNPR